MSSRHATYSLRGLPLPGPGTEKERIEKFRTSNESLFDYQSVYELLTPQVIQHISHRLARDPNQSLKRLVQFEDQEDRARD